MPPHSIVSFRDDVSVFIAYKYSSCHSVVDVGQVCIVVPAVAVAATFIALPSVDAESVSLSVTLLAIRKN